jgi:hypothetical protein
MIADASVPDIFQKEFLKPSGASLFRSRVAKINFVPPSSTGAVQDLQPNSLIHQWRGSDKGRGQGIGTLLHTDVCAQAIRARGARRWRIRSAAEIDAHDIALARR